MERTHYVYELVDPRDDLPFYVGVSTWPTYRYESHLKETKDTPKRRVIVELAAVGLKPGLRIIEASPMRILAELREEYWIRTYTERGIKLTNIEHNPYAHGGRILADRVNQRKQHQQQRQDVDLQEFYTAKDAAQKVGLPVPSFDRYTRKGVMLVGGEEMTATRHSFNGRIYYRREDVDNIAKRFVEIINA